jgi:hypothetical protein
LSNRSSRTAARILLTLAVALAGLVAAEGRASACACGCDIFDVGSCCNLPEPEGGRVYLEYDFQNQHEDWGRSTIARGSDNDDKDLRTHFITLGVQYMIRPDWGFQIEVPYVIRHFVTTGGASGSDVVTNNWGDFGDIRVKGIYDGFFDDHSLGVTLGLKLPTGNYTHNDSFGDVDRDSEIGTGAVDILLGGFYHRKVADDFTVFVQALLDAPVICRDGYYPGLEFDAAAGLSYTVTISENVKVSPLAQMLYGARMSDTGQASAQPVQSGFERILVSLGFGIDIYSLSLYADVEAPVYIHTVGDQLIAPILAKVMVSYKF